MKTDWTIRAATPDDASSIAHLQIQGWRDSYGDLVDQAYLDTLDENERAPKWAQWIAEGLKADIAFTGDGAPAGFVNYGRLRTPLPGQSPIRPLYSGEIYALYIGSAYWRQGLGRLLMARAAEGLRALKHTSLCLWTLDGNDRAIDFYKALGGQKCGKKDVEIGGTKRREICFGWRATAGLMKPGME